ncbi:MAG: D-glycero-beta-D-manno-heptose 1-phosphate adenylyltransferase [Bacteroidales bacterium]
MDYEVVVKKKIFKSKDEIDFSRLLAYWRFKSQKIVFTNGCFDILHRGHFEYLMKAASLGNVLVIGLNSDNSVKKLKGNNRPVQDEESRALALASLLFVEAVVIFDEETPIDLIKFIRPDILVKGGDYSITTIVGSDFVLENGGEVKIIPFVEGYSTTKLIQALKKE